MFFSLFWHGRGSVGIGWCHVLPWPNRDLANVMTAVGLFCYFPWSLAINLMKPQLRRSFWCSLHWCRFVFKILWFYLVLHVLCLNMLKTMLELSVLTSTCYIFDHICSIKLSLWYCSLLGGSIRPVVFPRAPRLCNTRFKRTALACLLKELYSGKIQLNSDCVGKRTTLNGLQLYVCVRSRDKTVPILPSPTPLTQ